MVVLYGALHEPIATNYSSDGKTWLGWKVHALKSDLTKHTLHTTVDLKAYSDENQYTATSDGYAIIANAATQTGRLTLYNSYLTIGDNAGAYSLFVRKGCSMYVVGNCSYAYFRPLE